MAAPPASVFPLRAAVVLAAVSVAALASGCHRRDRSVAVTTRLDCPATQGDLRRTQAAADGRSCTYAGPEGQEVTLAYLALDGRTPHEALRPTELELRAAVPAAGSTPSSSKSVDRWSHDVEDEDAETDEARASPPPPAPAAPPAPGAPAAPRPPEPPRIDRSWTAATAAHGESGHDRVRINLPFLHIDADGSGRAHVRTFGVDVDAGEGDAVVRTPGGGAIQAGEGGAEVRFGSVGRRRTDLVYIVGGDRAGPQGWRSAAYIARGPSAGPLVVATVRSHGESAGDHDGGLRDAKRLVNANVRGFRGFDLDAD